MTRIDRNADRRRILKGLGVVAAGGLAGCKGFGGESGSGTDTQADTGDDGDSGGGSSELGERVPTVTIEYWTDMGGMTSIHESFLPNIRKKYSEELNLPIEVTGRGIGSQIGDMSADKRKCDLGLWFHQSTMARIDPQEFTQRYGITWAGNNGKGNPMHYSNCEYSYWARKQATASSVEQRREWANNAQSIMSNDYATIPLVQYTSFGAANTNVVEPKGLGKAKVSTQNVHFYIKSEPKGDNNRFAVNAFPGLVRTTNYMTITSTDIAIWNNLVNSPLIAYNENYELVNRLASNYEVENDAKKFTVELKDAQFHNGDQVTSEDVKFTFKQLWDNPSVYPKAMAVDYDTIETPDDKTVVFNLNESFPPVVSRVLPSWGILHKGQWVDAGAKENPEEVQIDTIIGSGPFEQADFKKGQHLLLKPADGHPDFSPSGERFFRLDTEEETAQKAFMQGELHAITQVSPNTIRVVNDQMGDDALTTASKGFTQHLFYPYMVYGPTMFPEFREAVGAAINRQEVNQLGFRGDTTESLASCPFGPDHPWRPPDDRLAFFTEDPTGDVDKARQILRDAGWGWDDDGNLRYPKDADLTPVFPKGETPKASDFPCLSGESKWKEGYQPS